MTLNANSSLWARTALVWFLATMTLGMYLGVTEQFQYSSPHAHMGILGWLSSIAFAFLHAAAVQEGALVRGARIQWAAHNLGLATMAVSLYLTIRNGGGTSSMFIGIGGTVVLLGVLWLTLAVWPRLAVRAA